MSSSQSPAGALLHPKKAEERNCLRCGGEAQVCRGLSQEEVVGGRQPTSTSDKHFRPIPTPAR